MTHARIPSSFAIYYDIVSMRDRRRFFFLFGTTICDYTSYTSENRGHCNLSLIDAFYTYYCVSFSNRSELVVTPVAYYERKKNNYRIFFGFLVRVKDLMICHYVCVLFWCLYFVFARDAFPGSTFCPKVTSRNSTDQKSNANGTLRNNFSLFTTVCPNVREIY